MVFYPQYFSNRTSSAFLALTETVLWMTDPIMLELMYTNSDTYKIVS